jgi:hypothetical protein
MIAPGEIRTEDTGQNIGYSESPFRFDFLFFQDNKHVAYPWSCVSGGRIFAVAFLSFASGVE